MMSNVYFQPRKVIRAQGYDYSQNGMYFITICVWDRKHVFGRVVQDEMHLSEQGKGGSIYVEHTPAALSVSGH